MKERVAVVTGANRGIGLEVARQLAAGGDTVVLGARDLAKGAAAADKLVADGLTCPPSGWTSRTRQASPLSPRRWASGSAGWTSW